MALEGEWESFHDTHCVLQTLLECRCYLYPCLDATWNLGNTWYDRQQGLRVIYRVVLLHDQRGHGTPTGDHWPVSAATIQPVRNPFQAKELRTAIERANETLCNHFGTLFAHRQSLDAQQNFSLNVNKHSGKKGT